MKRMTNGTSANIAVTNRRFCTPIVRDGNDGVPDVLTAVVVVVNQLIQVFLGELAGEPAPNDRINGCRSHTAGRTAD